MGSICHVYKKEHWIIIQEGIHKTNQEIVYNVEIGEWNDYGSSGKLKVWILKDVYDKIMNCEYNVISQAYSEIPILIQDKNGNEIKLLGKEEEYIYGN